MLGGTAQHVRTHSTRALTDTVDDAWRPDAAVGALRFAPALLVRELVRLFTPVAYGGAVVCGSVICGHAGPHRDRRTRRH